MKYPWRAYIMAGALTVLLSGFVHAVPVRAGAILSADISVQETDIRDLHRGQEYLIDSMDLMQLSPSAGLLALPHTFSLHQDNRPANPLSPPPGDWSSIIRKAARHYKLPESLVTAVIHTESGFQADAVSPKGAQGAMQIMPETQKELSLENPYDPEANVMAGCAYLARQIDRFGSVELGLAAYNAGPENVERYGGIPPFAETRAYVDRILTLYRHSEKGADHES